MTIKDAIYDEVARYIHKMTYEYRHGKFMRVNDKVVKHACKGMSPFDADFAKGYVNGYYVMREALNDDDLFTETGFTDDNIMTMKHILADDRRTGRMAKLLAACAVDMETSGDFHLAYNTIGFMTGAAQRFKEDTLDD